MNRSIYALFILVTTTLALTTRLASAQSPGGILNSPHNLSANGPGSIRASGEQEVCVFCHSAHNTSPVKPAWNRDMPTSVYRVYSSTSLQAVPGQPTGSSKLCLSCHDGTIAVGSVLSRQQQIGMAGGITTLPPGASNLGTDLSDDHPISFRYDANLVARDTKLNDPAVLPRAVRLDAQSEMQCTTCHDPHDDRYGKFLVMDNTDSQLCMTCHRTERTNIVAHENCNTCHQNHTAPSGPLLLKGKDANDTCVTCHGGGGTGGSSQGTNILAELEKVSRHGSTTATPAPFIASNATAPADPSNVTCASCHEPHSMNTGIAAAPAVPPQLGKIKGINAAGAEVSAAQFGYEVCFKCHAEQPVVQPLVSRQIAQSNTRLEFAPSSVSFHPIETPGKNQDVPSLRSGLTSGSIIGCTDCHSSETVSGTGAKGPHGSNNRPLLSDNYDTIDSTSESTLAYALCYKCHDRASILSDQSFSSHSKHIVDQRTPCSVCHDPHGIPSAQGTSMNHANLINFDISVVQNDPVSGKLEYRSMGSRTGECYLSCHGVAHSPKSYPVDTSTAVTGPTPTDGGTGSTPGSTGSTPGSTGSTGTTPGSAPSGPTTAPSISTASPALLRSRR